MSETPRNLVNRDTLKRVLTLDLHCRPTPTIGSSGEIWETPSGIPFLVSDPSISGPNGTRYYGRDYARALVEHVLMLINTGHADHSHRNSGDGAAFRLKKAVRAPN